MLLRRQRRNRNQRCPQQGPPAPTPLLFTNAQRRNPSESNVQRRQTVRRRIKRIKQGEGLFRERAGYQFSARQGRRINEEDGERDQRGRRHRVKRPADDGRLSQRPHAEEKEEKL